MPQATLRANATALPDDTRLRLRLAAAAERIIAALDALDAPDEDLEETDPTEDAGDAEPSMGWPEGGRMFEFDPCNDLEDDPAESGIADADGLREQLTGEPSLGATHDVDQRVAWGADRLRGVFDGEAEGTVDDFRKSDEQAYADRQAAQAARAQGLDLLRAIGRRQRVEA